jgi:osmoprotectant transport system permease protein
VTLETILFCSLQHLRLVGTACSASLAAALILGIWGTRSSAPGLSAVRLAIRGTYLAQAVPSLAVVGLAMALLGIGEPTAIFALFLYSLVPMLRNTVEGLRGVDPAVLDAARGMGMSPTQVLTRVELPLALPVIFAGIRTAAVVTVGTAALSSQVGGGGLGGLIFTGLAMMDPPLILAGALPTALLAILSDRLLGALEHHLRGGPAPDSPQRRRRGSCKTEP